MPQDDHQQVVIGFRQTLYQALKDVEHNLAGRRHYAEQAGMRERALAFILRTCAAVCSLAALSNALPGMISYESLDPLFAAFVGGALIGVGLVLICRHGASLGGVIIVSLYVQEKYGISAGKVQLIIDCLILLAALMTVSWGDLLRSIAGAAVINLIMIFNFKKYRYNGFS